MLGLGSAVRIPLDLGIHMGVMINESRRNDQPVDIDRSASVSLNPPNLSDPPVFDCDIGQVGRQTGTIDYATTTKHQVIAHLQFLSMESFLIPQFRYTSCPPSRRCRQKVFDSSLSSRRSRGC